MEGHIYKIESPSGRIYIGRSIEVNKRLSRYRRLDCKNQPKIYNSILYYGWENHKVDIIDFLEDQDDFNNKLNRLEMFWIKFYNSNSRSNLNLTSGGQGYPMSQRSKDKLSKFKKGSIPWNKGIKLKDVFDEEKYEKYINNLKLIVRKKASKETKERMSKAHKSITFHSRFKKGHKTWVKGKNFKELLSEEEYYRRFCEGKKGMVAWNKGLKTPDEVRIIMSKACTSKKSLIIDDIFYDSIMDAHKKLSITRRSISRRCLDDKYPNYKFI